MVKVKATTILETIIAMTIILTIFFIAGMIFLKLARFGIGEKEIQADEILDNYVSSLKVTGYSTQINDQVGDYTVKIVITEYKDVRGVVLIEGEAYDKSSNLVATQKRIIPLLPN